VASDHSARILRWVLLARRTYGSWRPDVRERSQLFGNSMMKAFIEDVVNETNTGSHAPARLHNETCWPGCFTLGRTRSNLLPAKRLDPRRGSKRRPVGSNSRDNLKAAEQIREDKFGSGKLLNGSRWRLMSGEGWTTLWAAWNQCFPAA
jgi:hypothetical protein